MNKGINYEFSPLKKFC